MRWGAAKQVPSDNILQTTWKSLFNMLIPQMIVFPMARQSFQRATRVPAEVWVLRPSFTRMLPPSSAVHLVSVWFFLGICRFGVIRCLKPAKAGFAWQSSPGQQGGKMPLPRLGGSRQRVCVRPLAAQSPPPLLTSNHGSSWAEPMLVTQTFLFNKIFGISCWLFFLPFLSLV